MKKDKWINPLTNELFEAILLLGTLDETRKFFRDLLTESEIFEFANRFRVALMLSKKVPYTKIVKQTGMSSTTIARVNKWLKKGMGGYKLMIKKLTARVARHHQLRLALGNGP